MLTHLDCARRRRRLLRHSSTGILLLVLLTTAPVFAGGRSEPVPAETQLSDDPLEIVRTLASSAFGGRMAGSPGNQAAAEYLANTLRQAGLVRLDGADSMLEYYQQPVLRSDAPPALAFRSLGTEECADRLVPGIDFAVLLRPGLATVAEVQAPLAVADASTFSREWVSDHARHAGSCAISPFGFPWYPGGGPDGRHPSRLTYRAYLS
jgi:hypothetical protein